MQDFVCLLDGKFEEADAQLAVAQAAPTSPQTLEPLGVPEWATPEVISFCGKLHTMGDQHVALV